MPNLTIKNVPDDLHEALKETAARNRRSLNSEVIHRLERSLGARAVDRKVLLAQARSLREEADLPYLTDEDLRAAREAGRS